MRTINIHRPVSSLVFAWLLAGFLALSPLLTPVVQAQEPVTLVQTLASTSHCGTINSNQTWSDTGNVHVITCDVTVAFGVTLTIDEGTIVKFNAGTALLVQGTLRIVGTSANPVYLTSIKDDTVGGDTNNDGSNTLPAGGDWIEVRFAESSNDANSLIDHAEVRYSGGSRCCWTPYGAITMLSANPTIQNTTIRDAQNYAYRADLNSFPTLANNTLLNNGINGLTLTNDTYGNTINTNATWNLTDTTYYLRDQFAVGTDKTLTINSGVKVKLNTGIGLMVTGGNSALKVLGTEQNPVTFTSIRDDGIGGDTNNDGSNTLPARGDWVEIQFGENSNDANSLIDHAILRYGGGARCCWTSYGAITMLSASPTIQNTTIRDAQNYAYRADLNSFPSLTNNTLTNNGINGLTLTNDVYGNTINNDAVWNLTSTTYYLRDQFAVGTDKTLTIGSGVKIKLNTGIGLMITGSNSALKVLGTEQNPVTITSIRDDGIGGDTNNDGSNTLPARGDWVEIQFGENSNDANSLVDHAVLRYGGGSRCCWTEYGAVTMLSANPTIQNTVIRDAANYAYRADLNSFPTLTNNTLTNNGINGLTLTSDVYGNTINNNAVWNLTSTTYYLRDQFAVGTDKTLTIMAGAKVKVNTGIGLMITGGNSSLQILGTEQKPVTITSIHDDTAGGDTNNNGSTTSPAPGNWVDIEFGENSNDASSMIDHAVIRYGGGARCCWTAYGAITLISANPVIQNTTIRDAENYGISTNNSAPTLICNNIYDNGKINNGKRLYGLYNITPAKLVSAVNQWWGSASGPYHPTLNPSGVGNAVSDGVDFKPYKSSACGPFVYDADTVGVFRPSNGVIFLKNKNETGFADIALNYGLGGDYPVTGDWDGNGTDTIGVYRGNTFLLRNSNTKGFANISFVFGQAGDQPIAGDWNNDGIDTIGVYRPSTGQFLLKNKNETGPADITFFLGNVGDIGIAGDWNGDGIDTVGVFRPSNGVIFLKNKNETGFAEVALNYGLAGDKPVVGDWDNDGDTTIGVYRGNKFLLRNENTIGFANLIFDLGIPGDMPIAGNWDGLP